MKRKTNKVKILKTSLMLTIMFLLSFNICKAENYPASSLDVINYAKTLALSVIDTSFRGSWVIPPEDLKEIKEKSRKFEKVFNSLAKVKIKDTPLDVRKILNKPSEIRNDGRIWIYGNKNKNGSYDNLIQVFFNETVEHVIGITSFDQGNIVKELGVKIGDPIENIIDIYGEPVQEKDFIEDPDNTHYLGLHYLYPRSGVGFLIGQDKESKNLLVQGVLVFGKG